MIAVPVAAVVVTTVAVTSLLPGAAALKTVTCGPNTTLIPECAFSVLAGESFTVDCTGSVNTMNPADFLHGTAASIKICEGLRTDPKADCSSSSVQLQGVEGVDSVTPNTTVGWTAVYSGHSKDTDVILNGSCIDTDGTGGFYVNFTLKATTTTQAPSNNSATSAFGLATASCVVLLGLVVAAA